MSKILIISPQAGPDSRLRSPCSGIAVRRGDFLRRLPEADQGIDRLDEWIPGLAKTSGAPCATGPSTPLRADPSTIAVADGTEAESGR